LDYVILGGGGHTKVIIDTLIMSGQPKPYGIIDKDIKKHNTLLFGIPVLGSDEILPDLCKKGVVSFIIGVGSTFDNKVRINLFELGLQNGLNPLTIIHPTSVCSQFSQIGKGCQILPLSIVNAGAKLGINVIVNSAVVVEHDCVIGNHVHIATGTTLCSTVSVKSGVFIGAGTVIKQCCKIGKNATIGAGSVVRENIPANTIYAGVPAKFIRGKDEC